MEHIIVFCYIFTILIGVAALTVKMLAGKGDREKPYQVMQPFIVMLLFMNLYDFFIYYSDHIISDDIINLSQGNILLSIGDCMIAILVFLWLRVEAGLTHSETCSKCVYIAKKYMIVYFGIWLGAVILLPKTYLLRLLIDIPLLVLLLYGSAVGILESYKNKEPKLLLVYKAVITIFMLGNYGTYFVSESGVVLGSNESLMDLTIFYWLVINAANVYLLYKKDFIAAYPAVPAVERTAEEALSLVKEKFDLTKREIEILGEIYEGKTNTQIAEELFISESTVKAHIYNTFKKMNVKNRVEAVCIVREEKENSQNAKRQTSI